MLLLWLLLLYGLSGKVASMDYVNFVRRFPDSFPASWSLSYLMNSAIFYQSPSKYYRVEAFTWCNNLLTDYSGPFFKLLLRLVNLFTPGIVMKLILLNMFLNASVVWGAVDLEVGAFDENCCYYMTIFYEL